MRRPRKDPWEEFLTRAGQDISDTVADLGDGLLVAGIAALTGIGVAKAAPVVKRALAPKPKPAPTLKPPRTRRALAAPAKRRPLQPAGEVIDLHPGPDGVYH